MLPKTQYNTPLSIEDLLQFKALGPLAPEATVELERVQALNAADFNEAEVRSFIIDPIVRVLGYAKGSAFSVDLERPIAFLDTRKRPDYRINLWEENFWLIEAKRPRPDQEAFGYADLAQALEYACHPEINAALVVLCDGEKIEIFDREESVTVPILHLRRSNIVEEFNKIRLLLEPWQVWFFQKRRIVRLLDKVFSKEFNLARVDEFKKLVAGRLEGLRSVVLDNFRKADKDDRSQDLQLREAPLEELVDIFLFFEQNHPLTSLKIRRLVDLSVPSSFKVMYRIFPDYPRDANDIFFAHATIYLMALGERRDTVEWLPAWLSPGKQGGACVDEAIGFMIRQCLTYFGNDDSRRVILLTAAALRRVQKLLFLASEAQWRQAEIRHFIYRYLGPEQQWNQFVASPEGQAIGMLRANGITATSRFVTMCSSNDGRFNAETGKIHLKGLWQMECALLKAMPNYAKLCDERALGDFQMTEASCVTYDALGHMLLCLLTPFPRWRSYIQENHRDELEHLASMGLWSAREMLGIGREAPADASDAMFADRFFFGDTELFNTLRQAYAARP